MKSSIQKRLLPLFLLGMAGLFFMSYKPMPDGLLEPTKVRCILLLLRSLSEVGRFGETLGLGHRSAITRELINVFTAIQPKDHSGLNVIDTHMSGVPVRVYRPAHVTRPVSAIVFMHGGGWVICNKDSHDSVTATLARKTKSVVIAVDYRLAPEHPYPAAFEDVLSVTLSLFQDHGVLGVDPTRVALIGDSAGGNLAAAVSLHLRNTNHMPPVKLQSLIYPMLQAVNFMTPSYVQNNGVVLGTTQEIAEIALFYMGADAKNVPHLVTNNHTTYDMREQYKHLIMHQLLPKDFHSSLPPMYSTHANSKLANELWPILNDPLFMPLMESNLRNLPRAYIVTSHFDPLRDDGIVYAKRLQSSGVKVSWKHYSGAFHGVLAMSSFPLRTQAGVQMLDDLVLFLKRAL